MLKLDKKGQSLPIVLGVTALILANTYYFLAVNKTTSSRTKMTQTTIETQTEQSRISSYLADLNVCAKQTVTGGVTTGTGLFYNRTITSLSDRVNGIPFPLISSAATGSQTFLKVNDLYSKRTLQAKKFYLQPDTAISTSAVNEVRYNLIVEYELKNSINSALPANNTRKVTTTKIPLVIQRVSASDDRIVNCYARPSTLADTVESTSSMSTAVRQACLNPEASSPTDTNTAFLDLTTSAAIATCNFRMNFPALPAPQIIVCPAGMVLKSAGISHTPPNEGRQEFTCEALQTTVCPPSPNQAVLSGVVDSVPVCGSPASCGTGSMMIKNGSNPSELTACTTNCNIGSPNPNVYQLLHDYAGNGTPSCIDLGRITPCPTGQYAQSVDANGVPSCDYIKYRNVSCPAGQFATDMDPINGLRCQTLTIVKDCPGQNNFAVTFVNPTIGCHDFTN